jgi:cadmium resistance transport/sequestration family protein
MGWFFSAVLTGLTSFAATNIDDIVVLMMFFSQIHPQVSSGLRGRHIVIGQYLGFAALILASLPGYLGGLVLPKPWIGLLGLLPIMIGIKQWRYGQDTVPVQTVKSRQQNWLGFLHPYTAQVALVTLANGGDNIGIYVPLFASSTLPQLLVILGMFLLLIAVWCGIAYTLAQHPQVAPLLSRHAHRIVPIVLIGLGLYILVESGSYRLIPSFANL